MKVRWKLVAILIVPLCALVTLAWVGISQRRTVASEAGRVKSIVDLAQSTTGVMHELETEWVVSAMYVSSNGVQGSTELTAARPGRHCSNRSREPPERVQSEGVRARRRRGGHGRYQRDQRHRLCPRRRRRAR